MFSMFGTIKDVKKGINTKGIGLGLLISKLIVEKFNGKINFLSEYNKGTTFFFDFETEAFNMAIFSDYVSEDPKIKMVNNFKQEKLQDTNIRSYILTLA